MVTETCCCSFLAGAGGLACLWPGPSCLSPAASPAASLLPSPCRSLFRALTGGRDAIWLPSHERPVSNPTRKAESCRPAADRKQRTSGPFAGNVGLLQLPQAGQAGRSDSVVEEKSRTGVLAGRLLDNTDVLQRVYSEALRGPELIYCLRKGVGRTPLGRATNRPTVPDKPARAKPLVSLGSGLGKLRF